MIIRNLTLPLLVLLLLPAQLFSDIIKLNNGDVINGKILQQSNTEITFASFSRTVIIPRSSIIEVFKTASPVEDIVLLRKMGKSPTAALIESNYTAGEQKLEQFLATGTIDATPAESCKRFSFSLYAGAGRNFSSLSGTLPFGWYAGCSFSSIFTEIPHTQFHPLFVSDLSYCNFTKNGKSLSGTILSAGGALGYQRTKACYYLALSAGPGFFL